MLVVLNVAWKILLALALSAVAAATLNFGLDYSWAWSIGYTVPVFAVALLWILWPHLNDRVRHVIRNVFVVVAVSVIATVVLKYGFRYSWWWSAAIVAAFVVPIVSWWRADFQVHIG